MVERIKGCFFSGLSYRIASHFCLHSREDPLYKQSLGRTILNISRLIPHGLLVFFPSYAVMEKCQDAWISNGIWDSLNKSKVSTFPGILKEISFSMSAFLLI